jgi:hypothetical protein
VEKYSTPLAFETAKRTTGKAGDVTEEGECLPSKCEAINSKPSTAKKPQTKPDKKPTQDRTLRY